MSEWGVRVCLACAALPSFCLLVFAWIGVTSPARMRFRPLSPPPPPTPLLLSSHHVHGAEVLRTVPWHRHQWWVLFAVFHTLIHTRVHPLAITMHFMPVVLGPWCFPHALHPCASHCAGSGTISVDEFYGHFHGVQRSQFATRMFTIFGESHTCYIHMAVSDMTGQQSQELSSLTPSAPQTTTAPVRSIFGSSPCTLSGAARFPLWWCGIQALFHSA